jgi:sugar fermentation stimulation protein A
MIHNGLNWIGVNTSLTNQLAKEAIEKGLIPELLGYENFQAEVKIGQSRIDILLSNSPTELCYVEVKNVTLVDENNYCLFPDSVSTRGQKHLLELTELKKEGHRAVMLFIVQREDCHTFKKSQTIDLLYAQLLAEAMNAGVEVLVYQCKLSPLEIIVNKKLPII